MTDINYMSPSSIKPKNGWQPEGFLGGWKYADDEHDYQQMLQQQMELQRMGVEGRRMDLDQKREDLPLKALERQLKMTEGQAKLPLAGEVAREGQLSAISKNRWEREVEHGDNARKLKLRKLTDDLKDEDLKEYTKNLQLAQELAHRAFVMSKDPLIGDIGAMNMVEQEVEKLKSIGIDLPSEYLSPDRWEGTSNTLVNSIKQLQEIAKQREMTNRSLETADLRGRYGLQIQDLRNRRPTGPGRRELTDADIFKAMAKGPQAAISGFGTLAVQYRNMAEDEEDEDKARALTRKAEMYEKGQQRAATMLWQNTDEGKLIALRFSRMKDGPEKQKLLQEAAASQARFVQSLTSGGEMSQGNPVVAPRGATPGFNPNPQGGGGAATVRDWRSVLGR